MFRAWMIRAISVGTIMPWAAPSVWTSLRMSCACYEMGKVRSMPGSTLTRPIPNTGHRTSLNFMNPRFALLLLVMAGLVVAFAPLPVPTITPQERMFQIDARQFAYSPSELKVNPGDTVTIRLLSTDVVHG